MYKYFNLFTTQIALILNVNFCFSQPYIVGNSYIENKISHSELARIIYDCQNKNITKKDLFDTHLSLERRDNIILKTDSYEENINLRDAAFSCIEQYSGEDFLPKNHYEGKAILFHKTNNNESWRITIVDISEDDFEKAKLNIKLWLENYK